MVTCPSCHAEYPDGALVCEKDGTTLVTSADDLPSHPTSNELLAPGTMVGEYRIVSTLGEGGFGAVYRAEHPVIGKSAAIKVVKREYSSNPEMTLRFVSEARAVNQIRHKNIIDIFNFGALEDGRQYYVMELLDGTTLDHLLEERGRLTYVEAQPIFRQLARALSAAHSAGIAHRDLKPENVFVAFDEDGAPTAKLLDFGLAKLLGRGMSMHRTRSGVPMGTPLYMSPEQVYGRDVDHRTDVYAFGIMAYQMLTGELPFFGTSVMEVMVKQTAAERPDASAACADVPKALDEPLKRMMAKDPADRPPGILEAVDALAEAAQAAGLATTGGTLSRRSSDDLPPGTARPRGPGSSSGGSRKPPAGSSSGGATSSKRATPATSTAGLATGDTIVDPNLRVGAPTSARAKQAGIAALAVVLFGGAFIAMRGLDGDSKPAAASSMLPTPPSAASVESAPPVATASATVSPTSTPTPAPTVVKLRVNATPPDAEVWQGDKKIGLARDVLELPVGSTEVELQLKRDGFVAQTRKVVPNGDLEIEVKLVKVAVVKPAAPAPPQVVF